jgi:breast cancer 2 susceptibility protein
MDSTTSTGFVFDGGRGESDALASLLEAGGSLATIKWVKNHWSLIIWKVACLLRSKPELLEPYWKYENIVDQLKYRWVNLHLPHPTDM